MPMIDAFVILTPILLLTIVALLGFTGCATILGADDWGGTGDSNPVPTLIEGGGLNPSSATVCEDGFSLEVQGNGFTDQVSEVHWNNQMRATTFVSSTQLTAEIGKADISELDTGQMAKAVYVTVFNPPPDGGTSTPLKFEIQPGSPNIVNFSNTPQGALNDVYDDRLNFGTGQWGVVVSTKDLHFFVSAGT